MNVEPSRRMSRDEAIPLVQRLLTGDTADEPQASELLSALERGLKCPHIADYIFWDFDPALTAEKVVDRAMAYRPIAL
ncbi:e9imm peptide [Streptomyces sp. NPDC058691]|uniref:e9imm peptide n=1 Tax=Streptomyces sp. NPDC058691 TaxID=3346601 RepID=UPI00365C3F90